MSHRSLLGSFQIVQQSAGSFQKMYVFDVFNQILILFLNVTLIAYGKSDQIHVVYGLQILLIIVSS